MRLKPGLLLMLSLAGCEGGPPSTRTSSDSLATLEERVAFLEQYVTFRRGYRDLSFFIGYQNNGGIPPGPSDWDIGLVADVPPEELAAWIPAGTAEATVDIDWLTTVPGGSRAANITEWYCGPRHAIGIDRTRSIVAYHVWAH